MKKQSITKNVSTIGMIILGFSVNIVSAEWNSHSTSNKHNPGYGDFPPEDIDQRLAGQINSSAGQYQTQTQNDSSDSQWLALPLNENSENEFPLQQYSKPRQNTNNAQQAYPQQDYAQQTNLSTDKQTQLNNQQSYQQPYNSYPYAPVAPGNWSNNNQENTRSMSFNKPWNNSHSSFTMPWSKQSSGNDTWGSNPWTNNAWANKPWGNNSAGSSMMPNMMSWGSNRKAINKNPWDNLGNHSTSFTLPWSNSGSNFSMPWSNKNSGFNPWGN